jgi:hypothetical protein
MQKLQSNAMEELVVGDKLKRADILLSHTKRSLLGFLIRFGTDSYWNHAFMIYTIRSKNEGYDSTFIIESGGGGIDIHNITHYFEHPEKYDVAVKRLEADWIQSNSETGGLRYQRKIRGYALMEIDDKYDHKMIVDIARRFIRQLILGFLFPWMRIRKKPLEQRQIGASAVSKRLNINTYICSGFVQWSYYKAITQIRDEDNSDEPEINDILFNPRFEGNITEHDLLSTTPADLARSDKLTWKYVIKGKDVYEVTDGKDVDGIVGRKAVKTKNA